MIDKTLAEILREPCKAPNDVNLWLPTITFLLGMAIGGGLVFQYVGWML